MASGAYYAVAACKLIYAGWYADGVGCIGAYLAWLDDTQFWADMGIKFEVFRSGELKGLGEDSLSEPQRAYLQKMVDDSGDRFRKNVSKYRKQISKDDMEGQWYRRQRSRQARIHSCLRR
jgi:ClpP class serine protease